MLKNPDSVRSAVRGFEPYAPGLSIDEIRRRYGDTNSPAYRALLTEIEQRIAALPIHTATPR